MYFARDDISRFWEAVGTESPAQPTLIRRPFARPMATEAAVLEILKVWADAARRGQAGPTDIEKIDRGALPLPEDETLDACIARIERVWTKDWYVYVNDVHKYGGDLWERAVEILLPEIRRHGGLPAGGFKMELFFGRYGATPTGIHLDTSDNLAFIVRGPKRMAFWPPDRFKGVLQIPNAHAPEQQQALTRRYEDHLHQATVLEGETGDVIFWPKESWHVGASAEGWTAMITIPMWWNARPMTLAKFVLDRVLDFDGEPALHPFNPDAIADEALTLPETMSRPVRTAASQVAGRMEATARLAWASVASSYGFTVPPAKVAAPPLADSTRVRVKYPMVPLPSEDGCVVVACGHRSRTTIGSLPAGLARLNAALGAEYPIRDLHELLAGPNGDAAAHEACQRLLIDLVSCRALEVVSA
jgi:hypothetical protein